MKIYLIVRETKVFIYYNNIIASKGFLRHQERQACAFIAGSCYSEMKPCWLKAHHTKAREKSQEAPSKNNKYFMKHLRCSTPKSPVCGVKITGLA